MPFHVVCHQPGLRPQPPPPSSAAPPLGSVPAPAATTQPRPQQTAAYGGAGLGAGAGAATPATGATPSSKQSTWQAAAASSPYDSTQWHTSTPSAGAKPQPPPPSSAAPPLGSAPAPAATTQAAACGGAGLGAGAGASTPLPPPTGARPSSKQRGAAASSPNNTAPGDIDDLTQHRIDETQELLDKLQDHDTSSDSGTLPQCNHNDTQRLIHVDLLAHPDKRILVKLYKLVGIPGANSFAHLERVASAVRALERMLTTATMVELDLFGSRFAFSDTQLLRRWLRYVVAATDKPKAEVATYQPWLTADAYIARYLCACVCVLCCCVLAAAQLHLTQRASLQALPGVWQGRQHNTYPRCACNLRAH